MAIYYGTSSIKQDRVRFELWVIWKVIVRDIPAALLPILLFSLGAWHYAGGSLTEVVFILARSSLYAFMYTWTFCLSNQIAGIEEDRINKPDRPLASGAITYS